MKKMLISLIDPKVIPAKKWDYIGQVVTLALFVVLAILFVHRLIMG